MFITVQYGDDQSEIFNPACKNCNLLQAIKYKCDLEKEDIVDLSDQLGTVKQLHKKLEENAVNFFEERETLILLRVEKQEEEEDGVKYVPLLTDRMTDNEFIAKLNPEKPTKSKKHDRLSPPELKSARGRRMSLDPNAAAAMKGNRRQNRRFSLKPEMMGLPASRK